MHVFGVYFKDTLHRDMSASNSAATPGTILAEVCPFGREVLLRLLCPLLANLKE